MRVSQATRRDATRRVTTEISSKGAQTSSLPPGSAYGSGNDPVVLTDATTARNEVTARAYLVVPVARLARVFAITFGVYAS